MNKVLAFAAVAEAATGVALIVVPSLVARLLLGTGVSGVALPVARVAGIALLSLGLACWPGGRVGGALCGMLTYSALAAMYLIFLGIGGEWTGNMLWSAAAAHVILALLLAGTWSQHTKQLKRINDG